MTRPLALAAGLPAQSRSSPTSPNRGLSLSTRSMVRSYYRTIARSACFMARRM